MLSVRLSQLRSFEKNHSKTLARRLIQNCVFEANHNMCLAKRLVNDKSNLKRKYDFASYAIMKKRKIMAEKETFSWRLKYKSRKQKLKIRRNKKRNKSSLRNKLNNTNTHHRKYKVMPNIISNY